MMLEAAFGSMLYISYPPYVMSLLKKQILRAKSFACDDLNHATKVTNCEARIDNIN